VRHGYFCSGAPTYLWRIGFQCTTGILLPVAHLDVSAPRVFWGRFYRWGDQIPVAHPGLVRHGYLATPPVKSGPKIPVAHPGPGAPQVLKLPVAHPRLDAPRVTWQHTFKTWSHPPPPLLLPFHPLPPLDLGQIWSSSSSSPPHSLHFCTHSSLLNLLCLIGM